MIKNILLALATALSLGHGQLQAASDYRSEKQELVLEKTLGMIRRDESSAATLNALVTTHGYIKLTGTVTTINGAVAPPSPVSRMIIITNHTGSEITISDQSASATAANRFALTDGDLDVPDKSSASFIYDHGLSRWVGAGGGGGGVAFTAVAPIDYDDITKQLTCDVASGSQPGCLGSSDFTLFNSKQAGDADLTSIAAISGTNVIPYRSAADTWGTVTIGSGLSFTGGTLSSTFTLPLTTKGDILGYGASAARVPVGANDYALVGDSTQTNGVAYKRRDPGARNYVKNPGAEYSATADVTATNTTVTQNTSSPLFDTADFAFTIDSATDVVSWALDDFDGELENATCEVTGSFTASANGESVQVQLYRNGVAAGHKNLWTTGGVPSEFGIYAPCGDGSNATTLRVVGLAAVSTDIKIDHLFVGRAQGISRSELGGTWVGSIAISGCSSNFNTSSTSFVDLSASSCTYAVVPGSSGIAPPTSSWHGLTLLAPDPNATYQFESVGYVSQEAVSGSGIHFQFYDGANYSLDSNQLANGGVNYLITNSIRGTFSGFTSTADRQIRVRAKVNNASAQATLGGGTAGTQMIHVYKFPKSSSVLTAAAKSGDYDWVLDNSLSVDGITASSSQIWHSKKADTLYVKGRVVANGAPAASVIAVNLPAGAAIDYEKTPTATNGGTLSQSQWTGFGPASLTPNNSGILFADGSTPGKVYPTSTMPGSTSFNKNNANALVNSNGAFDFSFAVQIKGWTGSATAANITGDPGSWSGTHGNDCAWSTTSGSYADFSPDASCTFSQRTNTNFGTVTTSGGPDITHTPKVAGDYMVCATPILSNATATAFSQLQMVADGKEIAKWLKREDTPNGDTNTNYQRCGLVNYSSLSAKTIKLQGRTNAGTVQVNANGGSYDTPAIEWVIFPITQNLPGINGGGPGPRSEVTVTTPSGYGSTNTSIRHFTITQKSVGSAITYADSASLGASFTINEDGIYSMHYTDAHATLATGWGISVNSNQLTTSLSSITPGDIAALIYAPYGSMNLTASTTMFLSAGSVVRPHVVGAGPNLSDLYGRFTITKVNN